MKRKIILLSTILLFINFFLFANDEYISVQEASSQLSANLFWDPMTKSGILEKDGNSLAFALNQEIAISNFKDFSVTNAPYMKDDIVYIHKDLLEKAKDLFSTPLLDTNFKIGAILIDPGHGGKDPGAVGTYTVKGKKVTINEKDVNLKVGKMLYSRLKSAYPDKNISLTRSTDKFLSLSQRTDIANSIKLKDKEAILYISIHVNASLDKKASGYEVWYLSPGYRRTVLDKNSTDDKNLFPILNSMMEEEYTTESILIAKFIMDGIQAQVENLSSPRGIKAEEWFVVRNSNMPAVLVELGFVSNEKEALLLYDESYLQKLSLGIYNGLAAFVMHFERSRGFTGL